MKDLGGLGGACTLANDLNNQGQIIGVASLPGDTRAHPFGVCVRCVRKPLTTISKGSYDLVTGSRASSIASTP
jgi:hypothetical protein